MATDVNSSMVSDQTSLPSKLPTDLNLSISKILFQPSSTENGTTSGSLTTPNGENDGPAIPLRSPGSSLNKLNFDLSPSLTSQLANLFPSAQDLQPETIERKQAQIRKELAQQEAYIAGLLENLLKRQAILKKNKEAGSSQNDDIQLLSSRDLDEKVQTLFRQLTVIREKAHKSYDITRSWKWGLQWLVMNPNTTCKSAAPGFLDVLQ